MMISEVAPRTILVVRADNIGDLVCTTPLLAVLRTRFPKAWIGVLANSYNVKVLDGNPYVNEVLAYRKAKHRDYGESKWRIWLETCGVLWRLRRRGIDLAIVASPGGLHHARMVGAKKIVSDKPDGAMHEVERCCAMVGCDSPGPASIVPDRELVARLRGGSEKGLGGGPTVGVHISARRLRQRWSVQNFATAIRQILEDRLASQVFLYWSPGSQSDPTHPGDDENVAILLAALGDCPVRPIPTRSLPELVAGLALCDYVLCSDGGAMHVAAGLGKPIVALFGDSDPVRWRPWGVSHEVVRHESRDVADILPHQVVSALARLSRLNGGVEAA